MTKSELYNAIQNYKFSRPSTWRHAIKAYALYTISDAEFMSDDETVVSVRDLINHCDHKTAKLDTLANEMSYGACYYVYDEEIAEQVCTPSALKRAYYKDGTIKNGPDSSESWLDVQARAIYQAYRLIDRVLHA